MKRIMGLGIVFATVLVLALPFFGGAGPSFLVPASAAETADGLPIAASSLVVSTGSSIHAESALAEVAAIGPVAPVSLNQAPATTDSEHLAQKPVPKPIPPTAAGAASGTNERRAARAAAGQSCPGNVGGAPGGAPGVTSAGGVGGTTSGDLASFASTYNAIRVANCLDPVPMSNFRYDSCMEQRLFWMAEDPSEDPMSAWGHMGSVRSDGVPSVGCDGNLAGGSGNTGATVATKWWNSTSHRKSLYRPTYAGGMGGVCIYFAMTHGGIPNEGSSFTRAAARWGGC
jgi:hypothetical protein